MSKLLGVAARELAANADLARRRHLRLNRICHPDMLRNHQHKERADRITKKLHDAKGQYVAHCERSTPGDKDGHALHAGGHARETNTDSFWYPSAGGGHWQSRAKRAAASAAAPCLASAGRAILPCVAQTKGIRGGLKADPSLSVEHEDCRGGVSCCTACG
jgi:hypothetical protein